MQYKTHKQIRETWFNFFKEKGHKIELSSPLIPINDNSLLWINAGIAPLKKYFDGRELPPEKRLANIQKCLRTNDIENVGKTARHQTFFEMLGNFSIGDYFKKEAIQFGMEILTEEKYFNLHLNKLYFTVYKEDLETAKIWENLGVKKDHIIFLEGNFWEIGEGPCGPCTEIFYDRGEEFDKRGKELLENELENDRFIEIWNIVFSQFNSKSGVLRADYEELPAKNIDTGMGLERIASIIQNTKTNFETDLFLPIIKKIEEITGISYQSQIAFKVIADHSRTLVLSISDGAVLSNEGRGYVLRRILRRALKHAKSLNFDRPILNLLVDEVINIMKEIYPNIIDKGPIIKQIIQKEEEKFLMTLAFGEKKLFEFAQKAKNFFPAEEAFLLYDTYGFPVELTLEYLEGYNLSLDINAFQLLLEKQKDKSRKAQKKQDDMQTQNESFLKFTEKSLFIGYEQMEAEAKVIKVFPEGIVLDKTPFYASQGGQNHDIGTIDNEEVLEVFKLPNNQHCHRVENPSAFKEGDRVYAMIDFEYRKNLERNHSAAHLLQAALKKIIGNHVNQQGSNIEEKAFRFDFNNYDALTDEKIMQIENYVNNSIKEKHPVIIKVMSKDEAVSLGAIALFDEKYGKEVRMVDMQVSKELCSGTHVKNTSLINRFAIIDFFSIGSGIYRIEAATNDFLETNLQEKCKNLEGEIINLQNKANLIIESAKEKNITLALEVTAFKQEAASYFYCLKKREYLQNLKDAVKKLEKEFIRLSENNTLQDIKKYLNALDKDKLIIKIDNHPAKELKIIADALYNYLQKGTIFIAGVYENKINFIAKSSEIDAASLVKIATELTNGSGGGKASFAQGGGILIDKCDEVLDAIRKKLT